MFRTPVSSAAWGVAGLLVLGLLLAWRVRAVADRIPEPRAGVVPVTDREAISPAPEPAPEPAPDRLLDMVSLPEGELLMGSAEDDTLTYSDERPRHRVRLGPFLIRCYPVTRGEYRRVMGTAPSAWEAGGNDRLPANYVSWLDAVRFCNALSDREGLTRCYDIDGGRVTLIDADGYRLPTGAEWEYACRAGTDTPWFWGDKPGDASRFAWFAGNSRNQVHPVGTKDPNPWGLHDLSGNVWEWCQDWFGSYDYSASAGPTGPATGRGRVLRGGSARVEPGILRSALRGGDAPVNRNLSFGFRCAHPRRQP